MAKRATKQLKETIIAPIDDATLLMGAPKPGTKSRRFWQFAEAFAKGIASATGVPCIATPVHGPMDPLVQLCRVFAIDDNRKRIEGDDLLTWIEQKAYEFRKSTTPESVRYTGGHTHKGLANWLKSEAEKAASSEASSSSGIKINRVGRT